MLAWCLAIHITIRIKAQTMTHALHELKKKERIKNVTTSSMLPTEIYLKRAITATVRAIHARAGRGKQ
jgi:hypothetical protein